MKAATDVMSGLPVWVKSPTEARTLVFDVGNLVGELNVNPDFLDIGITSRGFVPDSEIPIVAEYFLTQGRYAQAVVAGGTDKEDYVVKLVIRDANRNAAEVRAILKVRG